MKTLLVATAAAVALAGVGAAPAYAQTYSNCAEARAAGVAPLHRGDPGYRSALDRDGDGIACEAGSTSKATTPATSKPVSAATTTRTVAAAATSTTTSVAAPDPGTSTTAASTSVEPPTLSTEPPSGSVVPTTMEPPPSDTASPAPTTSPTDSTTAAPTTVPPTEINVDIEIDDHSDHSVHYTYNDNSTFIVDGNRYANTYTYRDRDGKVYRGHDLDCIDFDNQADAQAVLDAVGSDLYWLDADRDGVACEASLGEFTKDAALSSGVRRGGQISVLPSGAVDTGRRQ